MDTPELDTRSERRRALDEQIASEPQLPPPTLLTGERPRPMEDLLPSKARQDAARRTRRADQLASIAQSLVQEWPSFFQTKGAGLGDLDTNAFMKELRSRAASALGDDFAERRICGENKLAPDFYFPDEAAIVEVAMSLRNPSSEFERDILKAIMAQEVGFAVSRLLFLSKPGAAARLSQPGLRAFADWALRAHGIKVEVREFTPAAETVLDPTTEQSEDLVTS
jgi:hypothetical protein